MAICSPLFLDKCSLTVPVAREDWDVTTENLVHARHRNSSLKPVFISSSTRRKIYEFSWKFYIDGVEGKVACLLQVYPLYTPNAPYMRLEWNPSKSAPSAINEIFNFLAIHIPNLANYWRDARLSRIDIAIDVHRISMDELLTCTKSSRTTLRILRQNEGRKNGLYLGARSSNYQLCIYDKIFERRKNSRAAFTRGSDRMKYIPISKIRIEFRFKDLGFIRDISSFENQLLRYIISLTSLAYNFSQTISWKTFIERCEEVGAQEALREISCRKKRAQYRNILSLRCTPNWYNPRVLWGMALERMHNTFRL